MPSSAATAAGVARQITINGVPPSLSTPSELNHATTGDHGSQFPLSIPLPNDVQLPAALSGQTPELSGTSLGLPELSSWYDIVTTPLPFPDHSTSLPQALPIASGTEQHESLPTVCASTNTYGLDFSQFDYILNFQQTDAPTIFPYNNNNNNDNNEPVLQDSFWTSNSLSSKLPGIISPVSPNSQSSRTPDQSIDGNSTITSATQAKKRHRNNIAARKYRQKRIDRIEELEQALTKMTRERDELKVQLAKRDGEVELLKEMVQRKASY